MFRKGKQESIYAQRFEDVLDDECYMTSGFMAEAAQECCELTRCFDSASMDTSIMIDEMNKFIQRLDFLFCKGGCWTSAGYRRLKGWSIVLHVC